MKKIALCMFIGTSFLCTAVPINVVLVARGETVLVPADYNESSHTIITQFGRINDVLADRLRRARAVGETNMIRNSPDGSQREFFEHLSLNIDPNFLRHSIALASEPIAWN